MYKNTIYANNPLNKSEKLIELLHEIDQIKFDIEGDKLTLIINECLTNKKSNNLEINLLIAHAFVMGFLKTQENKEAFSALSHIGFTLSLPLIVRHTFELWASINYSENCFRKSLDKKLKESERSSLNKKISKLVTGTTLSEHLLDKTRIIQLPIHINDMIRELNKDKSSVNVEMYYDILSEFCHPNFNFNSITVGMYVKYDFRTTELNPVYEKTLEFLFTIEKIALFGIKESLNNIVTMCFEEYQITWIEKPTIPVERDKGKTGIQNENFFQKILKLFN